MTTGERIKARRKELGMNAEALAKRCGVSPATIYRYEKGDIENMGTDKLIPIAEALSTTPAFLMGWDNNGEENIFAWIRNHDSKWHSSSKIAFPSNINTEVENMPIPTLEDEHTVNIVKIAGRDGSFVEKRLTDKQLQALRSFVDLLPDASDDL